MTCFECLAKELPLHIQRICELAANPDFDLIQESIGREGDLAGLFIWESTNEGQKYWEALANGEGIQS